MRLSKRTCIADTNVLSYVFKGDPLAIEYARRLAAYELATHDAGFLNVPGLRVITAATDLVVKEPPPQYGSLALHNRVRCSF